MQFIQSYELRKIKIMKINSSYSEINIFITVNGNKYQRSEEFTSATNQDPSYELKWYYLTNRKPFTNWLECSAQKSAALETMYQNIDMN